MANSKNTIQNIPLEGELCMNSLKTEVKQFAGYNEKNTTFYGGTLSPIYDKTTELFNKKRSYTFLNSKGEAYTFKISNHGYGLYKGNVNVLDYGDYLYNTECLDVPDNCVIAAKCPDGDVLYVMPDSRIVKGNESLTHSMHLHDLFDGRIWFVSGWTIVLVIGSDDLGVIKYEIYRISPDKEVYNTNAVRCGKSSFISGVFLNNDMNHFIITVYNVAGLNKQFNPQMLSQQSIGINGYNSGSPSGVGNFPIESFLYPGECKTVINVSDVQNLYSFNVQQFAGRYIVTTAPNVSYGPFYELFYNGDHIGYVGVEGDDISCPLGIYPVYNGFSVYYQNGSLISIGVGGLPVDSCLSYENNIVTRCYTNNNNSGDFLVSYKKNDGKWYCFRRFPVSFATDSELIEGFKNMVRDNRYVLRIAGSFGYASDWFKKAMKIYDTETDTLLPELCLDWIISIPPYTSSFDVNKGTTGYAYAAGINAAYMINKSAFVGYLPNPFIGNGIPKDEYVYITGLPTVNDKTQTVQFYYTLGDNELSAVYQGKYPQYQGTVYPIDPNGNVVLPISQSAQLIKGYSNNDLVKEGNTVYPLMYYNNTQKTYTYMLLSGMENITNAFSLQGQQYTVDDENIYAVSFNAGVLQNATTVAYKKSLTFLGTLPTQAVFWSDFNKTFYAFTGDRILSRMFEASDINKIEYVGQNPATLSLWICTDDGIYVLSDKDMFKLDYNSKQVAFYSKNAFIITEGATNNEVHTISLYLNDDEQGEMIPVKLKTAYYGLGSELKAVMDCWYLRLFDKDRTEGYVKVKVNTITDVTRHTEEKTFNISPSDYDDNNIVYIRYQPKYQECVSMQLELETNLGIYSMALGVNTTDSATQVSKFNF